MMSSPLERGPWVATPPRPEFERNGRTASRQEWRRKKPPMPLTDDLVFVAIAAYEDLELENTMLSLLHAAARPLRFIVFCDEVPGSRLQRWLHRSLWRPRKTYSSCCC